MRPGRTSVRVEIKTLTGEMNGDYRTGRAEKLARQGGMPGHEKGDVGPTRKLRKVQKGKKEATKSKEKDKEGNGREARGGGKRD